MIFPFNIKKTIKLPLRANKDERKYIKAYVVDRFKKLKVDKFFHLDNEIKFKNSFNNGQGRNHLFAVIDGGSIKCTEQKVIISFSTVTTALITLAMAFAFAVLMTLISGSIAVLLALPIGYSWLYGMNIFIFLIRIYFFKRRLKREIAELLYNLRENLS